MMDAIFRMRSIVEETVSGEEGRMMLNIALDIFNIFNSLP